MQYVEQWKEYQKQKQTILDSLSAEDTTFYRGLLFEVKEREKIVNIENARANTPAQKAFYKAKYHEAYEVACEFEKSIGLNQLAKSFAKAQAEKYKFKLTA